MTDKQKIRAEIERRIHCYVIEKNKEGASWIDKLSLGYRIVVLKEMLVFINSLSEEPIHKKC